VFLAKSAQADEKQGDELTGSAKERPKSAQAIENAGLESWRLAWTEFWGAVRGRSGAGIVRIEFGLHSAGYHS